MNITFIGDPHGKIDDLLRIINDFPQPTKFICVGDLGFKRHIEQVLYKFSGIDFYSVVGNHDYLPWKDQWPYLGNFTYFPNESIFTVRGANSIDKYLRTEGSDWFVDEEMTYQEGLEAFDEYVKVKPKIVVSHDCPQSVMTSLFGYPEKSSTRQLLDAMFDVHKPDLWVFGHHHKNKDVTILGTRFVCLEELETLTIEI